jgi:hypothetical protein
VQAIEEPSYDVAPFAGSKAESIVTVERDVHPSADERTLAVGASPNAAWLERWLVSVRMGAGDIVVSVHTFDPIAASKSLVRARK